MFGATRAEDGDAGHLGPVVDADDVDAHHD
jgi:hypothetical protein